MTGPAEKDELRIVPGESIGPFRVGEAIEPQLALLTGDVAVEERGDTRVFTTRDVSLFVEAGLVTQIGIHEEHPGATSEGLRLGMTLGEVEGELLLDPFNEVLLFAGVDGLCFSTGQALEPVAEAALNEAAPAVLSRADRIEWIGVHLREFDSPEAVPVTLE
ncbi:hypothetical protein [Nannocystis punicea]|uniref:Uncharacterized protein n=1 Tax=Nannocystis punicea TaxID=2995304 RepID=A0ABY7HDH3_9BACT|nr:hypothetical protein [Nannocystis poenicansa]WAS97318.1 hypothetical protein O0S08_14315 [Nannocystis poenicansa]